MVIFLHHEEMQTMLQNPSLILFFLTFYFLPPLKLININDAWQLTNSFHINNLIYSS